MCLVTALLDSTALTSSFHHCVCLVLLQTLVQSLVVCGQTSLVRIFQDHSLAVGPWAIYLTFASFSVGACKMRVLIVLPAGIVVVIPETMSVPCLAQCLALCNCELQVRRRRKRSEDMFPSFLVRVKSSGLRLSSVWL